MRLVWKTIDSPPRNWRSISKALILVDHLIKHGAERVVADAQQHVHDIACLNEFRYVEAMYDTGGGGKYSSRWWCWLRQVCCRTQRMWACGLTYAFC